MRLWLFLALVLVPDSQGFWSQGSIDTRRQMFEWSDHLSTTPSSDGARRNGRLAMQATEKERDDDAFITGANISRSGFLRSLALTLPLVAASASSAHADTSSTFGPTTKKESPATTTSLPSSPPQPTTTTPSSSTWEESISGFVSGAALTVTKTLVKYPLDTATVRLQRPDTPYRIGALLELFEGSYRGVAAPLLSNIPAGAVFFAIKDATQSTLKDNMPSLPRWQRTCLAVAAAQIPYWLVRNPSEVVKIRQQANLPGYTNAISAVNATDKKLTAWRAWQQVGLDAQAEAEANNQTTSTLTAASAYYTGFWENIAYAYPADILKFLVYDRMATVLGGGDRRRLSPSQGAIAGAAATAVAQLITTPLDVVRNRIMMDSRKDSGGTTKSEVASHTKAEPATPTTYLNTLVEIGRNEGVAGLMAGATPRVGKAILSGAIQFATYEETKQEVAKWFTTTRQR